MRRLTSIGLIALVLAACSAAPAATSPTGAAPSAAPSAASASSEAGPQILPILISSEILAGPNRFLFSLTDRANKLIAAPDVRVGLEFYDVAADENKVAFTSDARFLWATPDLKGLYATDIDFPRAGRWGTRFTATFPDGRTEQVRADYDVDASGPTPAIGAAAIAVESPTSADVGGDLSRISSDTKPEPRFYETSIADAVAARRPFLLVFATPAFCKSAMCAPMLDNVKALVDAYPSLTFINAEPYKMKYGAGQLQPDLDTSGNFQSAPWTDAWGLTTEPWIFVVDGAGKVSAKFEAVVGQDELKAALDAVVPAASKASGLVVAVDQRSLTDVRSFTLRTDSGEEMTFAVGTLDMSDGGFHVGHLREHMVASTKIAVEFTVDGDTRTATRLTDAE